MEKSEVVKRLSLLEDQKNLLLSTLYTSHGIENGTIKGDKDGNWKETLSATDNNIKDFNPHHFLSSYSNDDPDVLSDSASYTTQEHIQVEKLTPPFNMVNAEDTVAETVTWSAFELRVHHLEKSVYGFDPVAKKAAVHEKLKNTLSLLKRVDEVKKQFQTLIRDKDGLKAFFEQYDQVSQYVSPFRDAIDMERAILTTEAKAEIIAASEDDLTAVVENLKQIDESQGIIDAEEFKGLGKLFPLLTPIETNHVEQAAATNEVSARMTHLLDRYNKIINTLSEIFIAWDSILTTIETNIAGLERAKAKQ